MGDADAHIGISSFEHAPECPSWLKEEAHAKMLAHKLDANADKADTGKRKASGRASRQNSAKAAGASSANRVGAKANQVAPEPARLGAIAGRNSVGKLEPLNNSRRRLSVVELEQVHEGSEVDAKDQFGVWNLAEIRERRTRTVRGEQWVEVLVHFDSWSDKWDCWIPIKKGDAKDLSRFAQPGTHTYAGGGSQPTIWQRLEYFDDGEDGTHQWVVAQVVSTAAGKVTVRPFGTADDGKYDVEVLEEAWVSHLDAFGSHNEMA